MGTFKVTTEVEIPENSHVLPLRAQYVDRWGIIAMDRRQSVAEHSFNVAMLVKDIMTRLGYLPEVYEKAVINALEHDLDEIFTGYIPAPAKVEERKPFASFVKLADAIEAYRYCHNHCIDTWEVGGWVLDGLRRSIDEQLELLGIEAEFIEVYLP